MVLLRAWPEMEVIHFDKWGVGLETFLSGLRFTQKTAVRAYSGLMGALRRLLLLFELTVALYVEATALRRPCRFLFRVRGGCW